jgi:hypothetical protein
MEWYVLNGYRLKIPTGIDENSSNEKIKNQIKKEFNEEKFNEIKNDISADFLKIEKQFSRRIKSIFKFNIQDDFFVYLTNYGTGGSYNIPNIIIFNINNPKGIKTIFHEIIHLLIEKWVRKYELTHWEKERVVDLILNSKEFIFLEYDIWQENYHGVEKKFDKLFNDNFFKNPELFFSKIKENRC